MIIGRSIFAIAIGALVGLICAYILLSFLTPHYRGTMIVGPATLTGGTVAPRTVAEDNIYEARYMVQRKDGRGRGHTNFLRFETMLHGVSMAEALLKRCLLYTSPSPRDRG